jgi:hypothetical protein
LSSTVSIHEPTEDDLCIFNNSALSEAVWTAVNQQSQPGSANTSVGSGGSNQLTQFVQRESATLQIRTAEGEVLAQSLPAYAPTQTAATSPATSLAADTLNHLST